MHYKVILVNENYGMGYHPQNIYWTVEWKQIDEEIPTNIQKLPRLTFHIPTQKVKERVMNYLSEIDYCESDVDYALFFGYYYDPIDAPNWEVPQNMVGYYIFDKFELLSKVDFFKLCLQFAHKALEAMEVFKLKEKGIVDDKWEAEIKELIPKIEDKIKEVIEKYGDDEEEVM